MKIIAVMIAISFICFSCNKNDDPAFDKNKRATVIIEFDNVAGEQDLELGTGTYTNSSNEQFSVNTLRYYVSNFILNNTDGSSYTIPQDSSYFLVDESDEESHEVILNVPEGEYRSVQFMVGVDAARSAMDVSQRTGVLDPSGAAGDMYWDAGSGYIFFNMQGTSAASSNGGNYRYEIGGYGGATTPVINNIKTITLDLSQGGTAKVKQAHESEVHLMIDVLKLFNGASSFSIEERPLVTFELFSTTVADNISAMFRHDHTHN